MKVLGVILARAESKGLPGKCMRDLCGRPVIAYTFEHARASRLLSAIVFSTDCEEAKALARTYGIEVIHRPAALATDTATVDDAARHAVVEFERRHAKSTPLSPPLSRGEAVRVDAVVLLYGNIPVRRAGLIDEAIEKLIATGADSVRSVAPVTKQHPDWIHRLEGDRMVQFRKNSIYRRQDLEALYYHDGAVAVVTRAALFGALDTPNDKQSFLGRDRRAIVCQPEDAVDIDGMVDLQFAEAVIRGRANCQLPIADCRLSDDPTVSIAGHLIGAGNRAFVIAEAGVSHNGDVDVALRMVEAAKATGADAVKFQMFRAEELAASEARTVSYQRASGNGPSQRDMLAKLELDDADFQRIAERCAEVGIALIVTPFGVGDVERIRELGGSKFEVRSPKRPPSDPPLARGDVTRASVAAIKIASTDLTNRPLLEAAMETGLPLIVSTGASTAVEIQRAVEWIQSRGAGARLVLLHCVSAYPAPIEAMNLGAIGSLHRTCGVPVGLSDHSISTAMGGWAVAAGACVLEKHFTLDRSMPGPDHAMSLTPAELTEYVRRVREAEAARGDGRLGMKECEREVRELARKSIVTAVSIPAGARITSEMLTLKRPGTGLGPEELAAVVGREAKAAIPADSLLSWAMVR